MRLKGPPEVKRSFRLSKSTDFERVRRFGKSYAHPLVVLISLPNHTDHSRFGVAAGRSVGGAIERNRAKRRIRAALQALFSEIATGWDLVVLARRPLAGATHGQIVEALRSLLGRAALLKRDPGLQMDPLEGI